MKIAIIGPSNSGKSTLAVRLGKGLGIPVLHLDQIAHIPGSRWQRRPVEDFVAAHDAFIGQNGWVVEGNYSVCMPQRLAAADMVVWCDPPLVGCIWRYIRRCLRRDANRPGKLKDAAGEFSFGLIKYTLLNYPKNKKAYRRFICEAAHLDVRHLRRFRQICDFTI